MQFLYKSYRGSQVPKHVQLRFFLKLQHKQNCLNIFRFITADSSETHNDRLKLFDMTVLIITFYKMLHFYTNFVFCKHLKIA